MAPDHGPGTRPGTVTAAGWSRRPSDGAPTAPHRERHRVSVDPVHSPGGTGRAADTSTGAGPVTMAAGEVVVDDPDRLHQCIHRGRSDEREPRLLQGRR